MMRQKKDRSPIIADSPLPNKLINSVIKLPNSKLSLHGSRSINQKQQKSAKKA